MLTELDFRCLLAISDDYEEVAHVKTYLQIGWKMEASKTDISLSLQKLISLNLAGAYEADELTYIYSEVKFTPEKAMLVSLSSMWQPGQTTKDRLWFLITQRGLDLVKQTSFNMP